MDYITPLQKKRRHEGDLENWNTCQAKRLCDGVGGCPPVEYGAVTDCPMETWDIDLPQKRFPPNSHGVSTYPVSNVGYAVQGSHPQCCPQCMAGEPGHINHIMGY